MSIVFDKVSMALDGVEAENEESLDRLTAILKEGFTNSPRMSVAANEFEILLPRIRAAYDLFSIGEVRESLSRTRAQITLALWIYRNHRQFGLIQPIWSKDTVEWVSGGVTFYSLKDIAARIDLVTFDEGRAVVDFSIVPLASFTGVTIVAGVTIGKAFTEQSNRGEEAGHYLLSREIDQSPTFQHRIDLAENPVATASVTLRVTDGSQSIDVPLRTRFRPAARVTTVRFQRIYRYGFEFRASRAGLAWRQATFFRRLTLELLYIANMSKRSLSIYGARTAATLVAIRTIYWITRPYFATRKIWMTHDKMYSSGDSGEYMYRYLAENTSVTPYYAVNADSRDVPRLREAGVRIVFPRTLRHVLAYLNADVMLETHSNPASYNRFNGPLGYYLRDLVKFRILGIQHGLNVHDVNKTMHRTRSGIERLYCASPVEIQNILVPRSGFQHNQLSLAGCARFDGQFGENSREILVAPTWRPELAGKSSGISTMRKASDGFIHSEFFRLYQQIITDTTLHKALQASGHRLRFFLHPILASNLNAVRAEVLGDNASELLRETVSISAAGLNMSFDEALKRAAALVTDYSGVQFDIAYAAKPVIYFHSRDLPAQYDHGAMDYTNLGFGPICDKTEDVVDALIETLARDCVMEDKYLKRLDSFFGARDSDNCARIFNDAYQFAYGKSP